MSRRTNFKGILLTALTAAAIVLSPQAAHSQQRAGEKPKAAVYIIGDPRGNEALLMAVNNFLIRSGKYEVVAVDANDILAQEQVRQRNGSVSDADIAQLGKNAGAQYVCVVQRAVLDGRTYVSTRMVSVESGVANFSNMVELPWGESIIDLIERQIGDMLGIPVTAKPKQQAAPQRPPEELRAEIERLERQRWEQEDAYARADERNYPSARSVAAPPPPPGSRGNQIAGYVFGGDEMRGDLGTLAEQVVNGLTNTKNYSAPRRGARQFFREVEKAEQRLNRRGQLLDDRDFCKIGTDYEIEYLVIIDIQKQGRVNSVWARVIDLETCKVIATGESTALVRNNAEVTAVANELIRELSNRRIGTRGRR